jgi:hypothetical protein
VRCIALAADGSTLNHRRLTRPHATGNEGGYSPLPPYGTPSSWACGSGALTQQDGDLLDDFGVGDFDLDTLRPAGFLHPAAYHIGIGFQCHCDARPRQPQHASQHRSQKGLCTPITASRDKPTGTSTTR